MHSPIGVRMGHLFHEKWYMKGQGVGPREGASPYKNLLSTLPPRGLDIHPNELKVALTWDLP